MDKKEAIELLRKAGIRVYYSDKIKASDAEKATQVLSNAPRDKVVHMATPGKDSRGYPNTLCNSSKIGMHPDSIHRTNTWNKVNCKQCKRCRTTY